MGIAGFFRKGRRQKVADAPKIEPSAMIEVTDMDRNVIVYFGMGFLPEDGAVACREQAIAKMVFKTGNIPVLIGVKRGLPFLEYEKNEYDGIANYSIKYAGSFRDKLQDTFIIHKTLLKILREVGLERIKCFIMQDYQWLPMRRMARICGQSGIVFVPDIMDWFTPTRDYSPAKNLFKTADTFIRMHCFYPRVTNKIFISHAFADYFQDKKANTMVLPCTAKEAQRYPEPKQNSPLILTFAGHPGRKFEKEKLDWVIKALYENKSSIRLNIIGLSREECVQKDASMASYMTENIRCMGRLPHKECLEILCQSDFSIVVRKVNKLTTYGFSSKICEAFANGIPVIATANGDNGLYIRNGVNGYLCEPSYEAVKRLLKQVESADPDTVRQMKLRLQKNNPLSITAFYESFDAFFHNCTNKDGSK